MPCEAIGENLVVCSPTSITLRTVRVCPCCHERRRQVGLFAVWYDTLWTCCGCGDTYSAEGRNARPFARGWRDDARARARRLWAEAPSRDEAELLARAMVDEVLAEP